MTKIHEVVIAVNGKSARNMLKVLQSQGQATKADLDAMLVCLNVWGQMADSL